MWGTFSKKVRLLLISAIFCLETTSIAFESSAGLLNSVVFGSFTHLTSTGEYGYRWIENEEHKVQYKDGRWTIKLANQLDMEMIASNKKQRNTQFAELSVSSLWLCEEKSNYKWKGELHLTNNNISGTIAYIDLYNLDTEAMLSIKLRLPKNFLQ